MKRMLIGLSAAIGFISSVVMLTAAGAQATAGQSLEAAPVVPVTIANYAPHLGAGSSLADQQITIAFNALDGCVPASGVASGTVYILEPQNMSAGLLSASEAAEVIQRELALAQLPASPQRLLQATSVPLSPACSWEVSYHTISGNCQVGVLVSDTHGDFISVAADLSRSLTLLRGANSLTHNGAAVAGLALTSQQLSCRFAPAVELDLPGDQAAGANSEFEIAFASENNPASGCTAAASTTLQLGADGALLAAGPPAWLRQRYQGANNRLEWCSYSVAFPEVAGVLGLQAGATASVSADDANTAELDESVARASYAPIDLKLKHSGDLAGAASLEAQQLVVEIMPANGCHPGGLTPLADLVRLQPGAAVSAGVLSPDCSWKVVFRSASGGCHVRAALMDASGAVLARAVTGTAGTDTAEAGLTGTLVLPAGKHASQPAYQGGSIEFAATPGCHSEFIPELSVTVPNTMVNGISFYTGLEFEVKLAPVADSNPGCSPASSVTLTVGHDGQTKDAAVVTGVGAVAGSGVSLVKRPIGADIDCVYQASFPIELGSLLQQPGFKDLLEGSSPAATAAYAAKTIPVKVVASFPVDQEFTTEDTISYAIATALPCGRHSDLFRVSNSLQNNHGSQEETTIRVRPGEVTVYDSDSASGPGRFGALNVVGNSNTAKAPAKSYLVPAFADAAGRQPCTVRVVERDGPLRCRPEGGAVQIQNYVPGEEVFEFEFNHICQDSAANAGSDIGSGAGSDSRGALVGGHGQVGAVPQIFSPGTRPVVGQLGAGPVVGQLGAGSHVGQLGVGSPVAAQRLTAGLLHNDSDGPQPEISTG